MLRMAKQVVFFILLFFISLYLLVWVCSPPIVRYFLSDYLAEHQLVLSSDTSVRYNPFLSHLTIKDVSLATSDAANQPVLSIKNVDVELQLHQLWFDKVVVSKFIVDGLYLSVSKTDDRFEVAGVKLPLSSTDEGTHSDTGEAVATDDTGESLPYKLDLPAFILKNSDIELTIDNAKHHLLFNNFAVNDLAATMDKQSVSLAIDSQVNQSHLSADVKAQLNHGQGTIKLDVELSDIEIARFKHFLPENIQQFEGQVSYQGQHHITLGDEAITIEWPTLSIIVENLLVSDQAHTLDIVKQRIESNALNVQVNTSQSDSASSIAVEGMVQLSLDELSAFYQSQDQVLSKFKQLAFNDVDFAWKNGLDHLDIANITLSDALFSDRLKDEIPALAQLSSLGINQLKLTETSVAINDINVSGLAVDAQLSKEKVLLNLIELANGSDPAVEEAAEIVESETPATARSTEPTEAQQPPSFNIALNELTFSDDAHIHFTDMGVSPAYERHFIISTLTAGPFDNQRPDDESHYNVVGKSDKYANFNFSGIAKPFAETPFYHLKGAFNEVSLPGISAYIKNALRYEIQSGQLDLGLDVTLDGDIIDGDAEVLLRGIELTAADDHEVGTLNDQTSVPFNIALGMLKDSDGNVELSLPLSGNTNSPSFGVSGFMTLIIQQATLSAAKDYLITTFVPYASVVKIAIVAGELALKVRVNDLVYPAGDADLQPEHEVFLNEFAALMKDKDDLSLKLCAVATAEDIGKPAGTPITEASDIQQMKALSHKRVENFKDYMVEEEGISSSRLLLCTPQIDSDIDAKPSLTFAS